jgi:hypothetical protein
VSDYTRLARPYAVTGGRTEPSDARLALEALVELTWDGYDVLTGGPVDGVRQGLAFERRRIVELAHDTLSVAEVAAHLRVPLGVARVLVSDLADEGYVVVHPPPEAEGPSANQNLLEKVLDGLRAL